jgi:hypothetical protein
MISAITPTNEIITATEMIIDEIYADGTNNLVF